MPSDPRIRASDADRDRAAALLREHHAAGRLTAEEFHDRMNKALDATTLGEIDELMADLPAIDLYQLPASSLRRAAPGSPQSLVPRDPRGSASPVRLPPGTAAYAVWATVTATLAAIWVVMAVVGGTFFPWWVLIAVPWLLALIRRSQRGRE